MRRAELLWVLLCCLAPTAHCLCALPEPLCSYYWKPPLIFLGHVEGMQWVWDQVGERVENGVTVREGLVGHYRVELSVTESFRGDAGKSIIVHAGGRPAEDVFDFQEGGDYLVYAWRNTRDAWTTSTCDKTHRIVAAAEDPDLKWIRSLAAAPVGALIYGSVGKWSPNSQSESSYSVSPVRGVEVSLVCPVPRKLISDSEGKFSASALPPGRYTVSAAAPTGYTAIPPRTVEVVDRGCAELLFGTR